MAVQTVLQCKGIYISIAIYKKKKTIGKSYKCKAGHVSLCRFMINLAPLYCQRKEVCIQRCAFSVVRTGRNFGEASEGIRRGFGKSTYF